MFTLILYRTTLDTVNQSKIFLASEVDIILKKWYNNRDIIYIHTCKFDSIEAARAIQRRITSAAELQH